MKNLFYPVSKVKRIAYHRAAAQECHAMGFPGFAAANEEMADFLQDEIKSTRIKAERKAIKNAR